MGRNVIVSEETIKNLLEAHASLSAWYYQLWTALRTANGAASPPDDAARAAFVDHLAAEFPELASIARSIQVPRMYVPVPPPARAATPDPLDVPTLIEPAPARVRELAATDPPYSERPPLVDPSDVRYGK